MEEEKSSGAPSRLRSSPRLVGLKLRSGRASFRGGEGGAGGGGGGNEERVKSSVVLRLVKEAEVGTVILLLKLWL